MRPLILLDLVGLTPHHLGPYTPRLSALAAKHGVRALKGILPAVTSSVQASILTGLLPVSHGIVANGWLYRDTMEIRFWQQSRRLIAGETLYDNARRLAEKQGERFSCAKLFWWFNQGAEVDWSITPKPYYGCDGDKVFAVAGHPQAYVEAILRALGPFPFPAFWGPMAGWASSEWIAHAARITIESYRPTLTLVYLPHLDYDLQRFGASPPHLPRLLQELDTAAGIVLDAAEKVGATVFALSEYGITDVQRPVFLNRILREAGFLTVRDGPFGENLDPFLSRAFAVADHQVAHIYIRNPADIPCVEERLATVRGVGQILGEKEKKEYGLDHPRSGELIALAERDVWFAYPYWLEDSRAPDFARTVDIHRKIGYDPCELFFDPALRYPKLRFLLRLVQKKLGFRTRFDIIPLDPSLVRGSHGLLPSDPQEGPVFLSNGSEPPPSHLSMTDLFSYALVTMEIGS